MGYTKNKKTILILTLLTGVAVLGTLAYIKSSGSKDAKSQITNQEPAANTTSTAQTAQEDFADGSDREPGNSLNENKGSGSISDTQGSVSSTGSEANWTKSKTGEIIVYSPASTSAVKSGDQVSGQSTLPKVSFRIIDNVSGVIGEGELVVSAGKFSGMLNFETAATEGRIDIFATEEDGREYGNVEIPVRLK